MSFEEQIKSWVSIDNEIRVQNDILKKLRAKRNDTGDSIIQYVETENLHNATIKISDGKLRFMETKQQMPLTLQFVRKCLSDCIERKEEVEKIMEYIKDSRDVKIISNIKRSYTN